jgi:hypothetical protein
MGVGESGGEEGGRGTSGRGDIKPKSIEFMANSPLKCQFGAARQENPGTAAQGNY